MVEGSADDVLLQRFVGSQREGIGGFKVDPASDRWLWSPGLYDVFGRSREDFVPTWPAILSHVPESERELVDEQYRLAAQEPGSFSWSHRLVTGTGRVRSLIVTGEATRAGAGETAGPGAPGDRIVLSGFMTDVTEIRLEGARRAADEAVQQSRQHRATIEQAKGALMLAYRLTPEAAFELLVWHSSHSNRKVHVIATELIAALRRMEAGGELRAVIDDVLSGPPR